MADEADVRREWVRRVLGVTFDVEPGSEADGLDDLGLDDDDEVEAEELEDISATPAPPRLRIPTRPLLPIWISKKEELDGAIDRLQRALRDDGDEGLLRIAEYGLYKVTEGNSVRLMAALREADTAKSTEAVAKANAAVAAFRSFLASSPGVDIIENNPVDVAVPVRKTLGEALDELSGAMAG
ncbi:MAG: hypothetical protein KGI51_04135 [Rhodospirillales bacterium]|nr:hypothetical protein [Rhodospirillales bacterium]